jgi:hypothetical protein
MDSHQSHGTHEKTDAQIRPIVVFLVALSLLIVASMVAMVFFFNALENWEASRDTPPSPLAEPNRVPPQPRLDKTSRGQLDAVKSEDRRRLEEYQWIDREAGVVQIPIDRAMELLLSEGLPTIPKGEVDNRESER